jgi:hypothetical protein
MTLIIGKQCDDGVLLVADSASISSNNNPLARDALKTLRGVRGGQSFTAVFGGYAGNVGEIQTLDVIKTASCVLTGTLQDNIMQAVRGRLQDEVANGDWTDSDGKVDQAARDQFEKAQRITVLLSIRHDEWWCIDVTAASQNMFQRILPPIMAINQPSADMQAFHQIQNLCDHSPQNLKQAAHTAGLIFDRATVLFSHEVCYPGTAMLHLPRGIESIIFSNPEELMAGVAQYAP